VPAADGILISPERVATKSETCQSHGPGERIERQHIAIANETGQQKTFTKPSRKCLFGAVQER
jgi:hypothetical protein